MSPHSNSPLTFLCSLYAYIILYIPIPIYTYYTMFKTERKIQKTVNKMSISWFVNLSASFLLTLDQLCFCLRLASSLDLSHPLTPTQRHTPIILTSCIIKFFSPKFFNQHANILFKSHSHSLQTKMTNLPEQVQYQTKYIKQKQRMGET